MRRPSIGATRRRAASPGAVELPGPVDIGHRDDVHLKVIVDVAVFWISGARWVTSRMWMGLPAADGGSVRRKTSRAAGTVDPQQGSGAANSTDTLMKPAGHYEDRDEEAGRMIEFRVEQRVLRSAIRSTRRRMPRRCRRRGSPRNSWWPGRPGRPRAVSTVVCGFGRGFGRLLIIRVIHIERSMRSVPIRRGQPGHPFSDRPQQLGTHGGLGGPRRTGRAEPRGVVARPGRYGGIGEPAALGHPGRPVRAQDGDDQAGGHEVPDQQRASSTPGVSSTADDQGRKRASRAASQAGGLRGPRNGGRRSPGTAASSRNASPLVPGRPPEQVTGSVRRGGQHRIPARSPCRPWARTGRSDVGCGLPPLAGACACGPCAGPCDLLGGTRLSVALQRGASRPCNHGPGLGLRSGQRQYSLGTSAELGPGVRPGPSSRRAGLPGRTRVGRRAG